MQRRNIFFYYLSEFLRYEQSLVDFKSHVYYLCIIMTVEDSFPEQLSMVVLWSCMLLFLNIFHKAYFCILQNEMKTEMPLIASLLSSSMNTTHMIQLSLFTKISFKISNLSIVFSHLYSLTLVQIRYKIAERLICSFHFMWKMFVLSYSLGTFELPPNVKDCLDVLLWSQEPFGWFWNIYISLDGVLLWFWKYRWRGLPKGWSNTDC